MTDDELIRQMVDMSRVLQTDRQCMVQILRLVREHDAKHRAAANQHALGLRHRPVGALLRRHVFVAGAGGVGGFCGWGCYGG